MIFKSCIENSVFLNEWKKANVILFTKRRKKNLKTTDLLRYFQFVESFSSN